MIRKQWLWSQRLWSVMPVRLVAYALTTASIFWSVAYLLASEQAGNFWALESRLVLFGGLSSVAVTMALTFWVVNRLEARLKKWGFEDFGLVRQWARFLRAHHAVIGWAALTTAAAHTLYFASVSLDFSAHATTGWVALVTLVALVAAGVRLNWVSRARDKPQRAENAREHRRSYGRSYGRVRRMLAALFVVAVSFHMGFPVVVLGLWIVLAIPTALVWRRRRSRHNIEKKESVRGSSCGDPANGDPANGEPTKIIVPGQRDHL